jgi:hypothetical protein
MERIKLAWKRVPDKPRRIVTFILGVLLILLSALIGWIPGPGGMIPFLLGIAVLATEFTWAERLRDRLLEMVRQTCEMIKRRPFFSIVVILLVFSIFGYFVYSLAMNIL